MVVQGIGKDRFRRMALLLLFLHHTPCVRQGLVAAAAGGQHVQPAVPDVPAGFRMEPVREGAADPEGLVQILERRIAVLRQVPDDVRNVAQTQHEMFRLAHALVRMVVRIRRHIIHDGAQYGQGPFQVLDEIQHAPHDGAADPVVLVTHETRRHGPLAGRALDHVALPFLVFDIFHPATSVPIPPARYCPSFRQSFRKAGPAQKRPADNAPAFVVIPSPAHRYGGPAC